MRGPGNMNVHREEQTPEKNLWGSSGVEVCTGMNQALEADPGSSMLCSKMPGLSQVHRGLFIPWDRSPMVFCTPPSSPPPLSLRPPRILQHHG